MLPTALPELVERAVEAAIMAGRAIMAVHDGEVKIDLKEDRSPLTEADRQAHRWVSDVLSSTGLPILSEEGEHPAEQERQAWQHYWLVDPLDGTREFIKGNGEFTVNIALMGSDARPDPAGVASPIAGVLYVPVSDVLYFAWQGGGAYRQEGAATITGVSAYDRASMASRLPDRNRTAYTIATSRSHIDRRTEAYISSLKEQHAEVRITTMGSALKICLVAEGSADVYPRFGPTMEWDTAAGHAICLEAGGQVKDLVTNAPMRYNKKDLMNNAFIVERS